MLKYGETLKLQIQDLAYGGRGVARHGDYVIFVEGGLPGQEVTAKITKRKKNHAEARIIDTITPSPDQVEAPCPYFGTCGGCKWQHLEYSAQLKAKQKQVKDLLERVGQLKNIEVQSVIPADEIYSYRNKMDFTFSNLRWIMDNEPQDVKKDFALGLHVPGRFDKVLNIDHCLLQSEKHNQLLKACHTWVENHTLKPYNQKGHTGFWRFLVLREGFHTNQSMLNLMTSSQFDNKEIIQLDQFIQHLEHHNLPIHSLLHSITDRLSDVSFGDSEEVIQGNYTIQEKLGHCVFEISPNAFFQTNTKQAEKLFQTIVDLADFNGSETLYDLYCGTGAIGIFIGDKVKKTIGIEVIETAIKDAEKNAELNHLKNIQFVLADMKDALKETEAIIELHGQPDAIILDPPRGGTHPKTIKHLLELNAHKIIYVSCNPSILARDLNILCETEYKIEAVQPVDMFPHTPHIEVVTVLKKKK